MYFSKVIYFSLFFLNNHSSASYFDKSQWPSGGAKTIISDFCVLVLMGRDNVHLAGPKQVFQTFLKKVAGNGSINIY